jgi:hypothetical protein
MAGDFYLTSTPPPRYLTQDTPAVGKVGFPISRVLVVLKLLNTFVKSIYSRHLRVYGVSIDLDTAQTCVFRRADHGSRNKVVLATMPGGPP